MRKSDITPTVVGRPEGAEAERSEAEVTGGRPTTVGATARPRPAHPDPEVPATARRRQFSAAYKLRVLKEADASKETGGVGAMLRREGLYSSHLTTWRKQRDAGQLEALSPRKRGRKVTVETVPAQEHRRVVQELAQVKRELAKAELIIDVQKKVSLLLGISLDSDGKTS